MAKIGWGGSKLQRLKFNSIFWLMRALLTEKIQFEEEMSKIKCLWTQLNFIQGLIEFINSLIARKLIFKSIWALIGRN